MAVAGTMKAIEAGRLESYDLASDPREAHDLGAGANLPAAMRKGLDDYPLPSVGAASSSQAIDAETRARLASLGYLNASSPPVFRKDAPRPADMVALLPVIERAAGLFEARDYAAAIPLLEQIRAKDPHNLDATLQLATCESSLGRNAAAEAMFREAAAIAPDNPDVRVYLALHYARVHDWARAAPLLQQASQQFPDRAPVVEAMGQMAMEAGRTADAIAAFEHLRALQGAAFLNDLDLGVLYMDARRFDEARQALDRVAPGSPNYPMAVFKRAEVSVLLHEPDAASRIAVARAHADAETRPLIARDRLFQR
jgi:Tfp pilus assembly protein PilF